MPSRQEILVDDPRSNSPVEWERLDRQRVTRTVIQRLKCKRSEFATSKQHIRPGGGAKRLVPRREPYGVFEPHQRIFRGLLPAVSPEELFEPVDHRLVEI